MARSDVEVACCLAHAACKRANADLQDCETNICRGSPVTWPAWPVLIWEWPAVWLMRCGKRAVGAAI
ncbi:hypothetical protein E3N88_34434 [Mikania micrantha]|uniref:Uncharacterized protein n=1 Tax=Mikania micrantha TaxID=192012 RepID=A0A5N6LY43_9ASTR|nr:hypothetical protein E3N88_34434 [Mikania micrantha]